MDTYFTQYKKLSIYQIADIKITNLKTRATALKYVASVPQLKAVMTKKIKHFKDKRKNHCITQKQVYRSQTEKGKRIEEVLKLCVT